MRPNTLPPAPAQLGGPFRIALEIQNPAGQVSGVVRLHQQAAAGGGDDLREDSPPRLDHRNAAGLSLQRVESPGLVVAGGHRENVQLLQKTNLLRTAQAAPVLEAVLQAPPAHSLPDPSQIAGMIGGRIAGHQQARPARTRLAGDAAIGFAEQVQPLLGRDPGQVSHGEGTGRRGVARLKVVDVDSRGNHADLGAREFQVVSHRPGVVAAHGVELIDELGIGPDPLSSLGPIGFLQRLQEQVLALESTADGGGQGLFHGGSQTAEQAVPQVHQVRPGAASEPAQEFLQLLALETRFAPEDRDRGLPQFAGIGPGSPAAGRVQQPGGVQDPVQKPGSRSEKGKTLLQIDVDTPEERGPEAHVGFVGDGRSVEGNQLDVVPAGQEVGGQGVVPKAGPAVSAPGARRDVHDPHGKKITPGPVPAARQ